MNEPHPNISVPASLVGEPTRAAILMALCDGRAHAAGAIADALHISPQSASNHLARLIDGGLLVAVRQGRHKYYRLASVEVAQSIEALAAIAPPISHERLGTARAGRDLMLARCCYRHLAGRLGVAVLDALLQKGYLARDSSATANRTVFALTPSGRRWIADIGAGVSSDVSGTPVEKFAYGCIDWTERREHLAGTLADSLLRWLQAQRYLLPHHSGRSLHLTSEGELFFERELNITRGTLEIPSTCQSAHVARSADSDHTPGVQDALRV